MIVIHSSASFSQYSKCVPLYVCKCSEIVARALPCYDESAKENLKKKKITISIMIQWLRTAPSAWSPKTAKTSLERMEPLCLLIRVSLHAMITMSFRVSSWAIKIRSCDSVHPTPCAARWALHSDISEASTDSNGSSCRCSALLCISDDYCCDLNSLAPSHLHLRAHSWHSLFSILSLAVPPSNLAVFFLPRGHRNLIKAFFLDSSPPS